MIWLELLWRLRWQVALAVMAVFACTQRMTIDHLHAEIAERETAAAKAIEKAQAEAWAHERADVAAMAVIADRYEKEKEDALAAKDAVIADLRSGAIRLRSRFTCPVTAIPHAGARTGGSDDAAQGGLRVEDAQFLVSESERADEVVRQLTACQAVIVSDRAQQKP